MLLRLALFICVSVSVFLIFSIPFLSFSLLGYYIISAFSISQAGLTIE